MLRNFCFVFLFLFSANLLKAQETPQAVTGITVKEGVVSPYISAVGTFVAYHDVMLKAEVPGRIETVHFKEGDHVLPNQVLFTFYNAEQKARVKKAEATLKLDRNSLERKKKLVEKKFISPEAFEHISTQVQLSQADLTLEKEALEKTKVKAPFEGNVSERSVSKGSYVIEGDRLVRIQDITPIRLIFQLPQKEFTSLKKGDEVIATTDLYEEISFKGSIEAI